MGIATTVVRLGPVVAMVSLLGEAVQQQAHMPGEVAWLEEAQTGLDLARLFVVIAGWHPMFW